MRRFADLRAGVHIVRVDVVILLVIAERIGVSRLYRLHSAFGGAYLVIRVALVGVRIMVAMCVPREPVLDHCDIVALASCGALVCLLEGRVGGV